MRYDRALTKYDNNKMCKQQYLYELERASKEGFTDLIGGNYVLHR